MPPFRSIERRITISRVQRPIAEVPETGAVYLVAATSSDGVDDTSHGAAEFRGKAIGEHLKLLHSILGKLRRYAGAPCVFVVETVGCVVAVGQKSITHSNTSKTDQPECPIGH